ncbi:MAG: glycerophosphodiester phosphodiesterase family protein [Litorimonas sp.]
MNAKHLPLSIPVFVGLLTACANAGPPTPSPFAGMEALPPIRTVMECLPKEAAMVAAHRGTSASYLEPENSISALERLILNGTIMAEIDIAAIRDGTPIIFHDGVWDYHTDQTGPVVATSAEDFARLRLKNTKDAVTVEPVPTLAAMLDAAKDRIYLEVDFKTSSDMGATLQMIRDRDMVDQVVLIATDDAEAAALKPYADEFFMSLPQAPKAVAGRQKQGVWIGARWKDGAEKRIQPRNYVIGAQWQKNPAELAKAAKALDILVTDQAQRYAPIAQLDKVAAFRNCLKAADKP